MQLNSPSSEMASSLQHCVHTPSVQSHPVLPCSLSHSEPAPPAQLAPAYDLLKPSAHSPSGAAPPAEGSPEPMSGEEVGAAELPVGAEVEVSPEPRSLDVSPEPSSLDVSPEPRSRGPPTKTSSPCVRAPAFAAAAAAPVVFAAAPAASLGGPVHSSQPLHRSAQAHLTDQALCSSV